MCAPKGPCPTFGCADGTLPNPTDPCGCPVCALPDAGVGKDGGAGAEVGGLDAVLCPRSCPAVRCAYGSVRDPICGCETRVLPDAGPEAGKDAAPDVRMAGPCALPLCSPGYAVVDHPCACPTCERVDAGQPDVRACPAVACPAIACPDGIVPNPTDPCACPVCASPDGGAGTCVGLDECSCSSTDGCSVIADACYCPFPQCGQGACVCGGGKFVACAPAGLNGCAAAKARVVSLCPTLSGATFDGLCQQAGSACITKCLNEVTSCASVSCSFCEACDCAGDRFSACVASCRVALGN